MSDNRQGVLDVPINAVIPKAENPNNLDMLPGRLLVRMATHPETKSGILLTDKESKVCDLGIVCATGDPEIPVESLVLLRPYSGAYLEGGYRMLGVNDPLDWDVVAMASAPVQDGEWTFFPLSPWTECWGHESEHLIKAPVPLVWRYDGALTGLDHPFLSLPPSQMATLSVLILKSPGYEHHGFARKI